MSETDDRGIIPLIPSAKYTPYASKTCVQKMRAIGTTVLVLGTDEQIRGDITVHTVLIVLLLIPVVKTFHCMSNTRVQTTEGNGLAIPSKCAAFGTYL